MKPDPDKTQRQDALLDSLYEELPTLECKRLCQECCGPVFASEREIKRTGTTPEPLGKAMECPLLKDGQCSIYAKRPMLCRLWGLVKKMRCPHGCEPSRWLTDQEAKHYLRLIGTTGEMVPLFKVPE